MMEPFDLVVIDTSAEACEGCEGGLLGTPDDEIVGSMDALGVTRLWHAPCAPLAVQRILMWARSRELAQWN